VACIHNLAEAAGPDVVLVAKGNCGIPQYVDGAICYNGTPELMAVYARMALDAGARIIGGCCGTSPRHLRAMRDALDAHTRAASPSWNRSSARWAKSPPARGRSGAVSRAAWAARRRAPTSSGAAAGARRRRRLTAVRHDSGVCHDACRSGAPVSAHARGLWLVLGATFFWSLSGVFVRWLPSTDPWTFNAWRGLGMALSLVRLDAAALPARGRGPVPPGQPGGDLIIAAGFFAVGSSAYILALQLSSVAAVSCLGATSGICSRRCWRGCGWASARRLVFYVATLVSLVGVAVIAFSEAQRVRSVAWPGRWWRW
jgi:hypothetical protein